MNLGGIIVKSAVEKSLKEYQSYLAGKGTNIDVVEVVIKRGAANNA